MTKSSTVINQGSDVDYPIHFQRGWFERFFRWLLGVSGITKNRKYFLETTLTTEGISIAQLFRNSVVVPWSAIECMDLSGLQESHFQLMSFKPHKFFLVMIPDNTLLRSSIGVEKTWYAASNVLGLTQIKAEDADLLRLLLNETALQKNIKLDVISLGE